MKNEKLILIHKGRGGRFYNAGYKSCEGIIDYFDPEYFGINTYFDDDENPKKVFLDNGEEPCTYEELNSERGSFDIDGDYDSYYWYPLSNANQDDIEIMIRDLLVCQYKDELIRLGIDENVFKLLEKTDNLMKYAADLVPSNPTKFKDFLRYSEVIELDEIDFDYDYVEIDDKYYAID